MPSYWHEKKNIIKIIIIIIIIIIVAPDSPHSCIRVHLGAGAYLGDWGDRELECVCARVR
jgi:hypothetical protein